MADQVTTEFLYMYVANEPGSGPGTYNPADIDAIVMALCTGCACGTVALSAATLDPDGHPRLLALASYSHDDICARGHGAFLSRALRAEARRHGIPDCIIGSEDPHGPVLAYCERDHVCEKHPAQLDR